MLGLHIVQIIFVQLTYVLFAKCYLCYMFSLLYVHLFNWAIDPLAKVLCSIGFLFNSFWAIRDVQWDMFGSPATVQERHCRRLTPMYSSLNIRIQLR